MEYQGSTDLLYPFEVNVNSGVMHPSTPDPGHLHLEKAEAGLELQYPTIQSILRQALWH